MENLFGQKSALALYGHFELAIIKKELNEMGKYLNTWIDICPFFSTFERLAHFVKIWLRYVLLDIANISL